MALKYARGRKSMAICDRSGLRVRYKDLKTTWDGLRVAPDQWEPKHPQLTPRKNVFDATALFDARPNRDPENVEIFIGFNYDPFVDIRDRPSVGVSGFGATGVALVETTITETGVGGTGAVGDKALELSIDEAGVAGTGAVGTLAFESTITETGVGGTGAIGDEALELSIDEAGVAGTGGVGVEIPVVQVTGVSGSGGSGSVGIEALNLSIVETGVGGTGGVGNETAQVLGWGQEGWGNEGWGE